MYYIKLPTYSNFFNIAICPIDTQVTLCYIVDKEETISVNSDSDYTYLPFLPGHLYIMYRGKGREERVTYFKSEQNMWDYVKPILGTDNGRFFLHEYIISKDWVPHLTPEIHYPEVSHNERLKTVPKLRGGVNKPKVLLTESIGMEMEQVLTLLRSLDILTEHGNHDKCMLTKKDVKRNLCEFCLIRSLVIRSKSSKGRNHIKPVEFFGMGSEQISFREIFNFIRNICPDVYGLMLSEIF